MDGSLLAELAVALDDVDLARRALEILSPLAGRMAVSGFSVTIGPVDGYLALATAVLAGRSNDGSRRYADAAVRSATAWDLPLYLHWLEGHRAALGI
jgi:hypothetical protein